MLSREIRQKFLQYFKEKGHRLVPSSSTVPYEDPTLLFVNAGMNQFKEIFLGKNVGDYKRAVSAQKCIRVGGKHNDLDQVGHTKRHMTFFEMLGNFSFGDYFKKEAILFAWEVSTEIFGFPKEKLFVSVYEKDDEAFELWREIVDEKKISRLGKKDNFWSMGETGPCGGSSELFFDRGPSFGTAQNVAEDREGERFLEFWNLVFMEYNRDESAHLASLPKQSIDTGAGLERIVSLMMNVPTVFQTDILASIIQSIEEIAGKKYNPRNGREASAFHVIADHIRSLSFAIADGAEPGNVERGYVLRKVLRRSVRYGRILGLNRPFLASILPRLIETMGDDYHELKAAQSRIAEILTTEEESFLNTLKRGGNILSHIIRRAQKSHQKEIGGEEAFKLKDTYGFPIEEILLIAKDSGLSVNLEQYQILEEQAKERSRKSKPSSHQIPQKNMFEALVSKCGTSTFVGYHTSTIEASIKGLIINGKSVDMMEEGQEGWVILDQTPFYAEKGGQVGDRGTLSHQSALFEVKDSQSPFPDITVHIGTLKKGTLIIGEPVIAAIEIKRRRAIEKHHSATHLLHYALQQVLGPHIRQAGSFVEPERLRFDFNHHKPLSKEEIRSIEQLVNEKIWENSPIKTYVLPFETVQNHFEIKQFFGEKYGKKVRVVDIDHYSKELCGGTHVDSLGSIGIFRIIREGSIAKGIRRIEGAVGLYAEKLHYQLEDRLIDISNLLKTSEANLGDAIDHLIRENERLKKEALFNRQKELEKLAHSLISKIEYVNQIPLLNAPVEIEKKEMVQLSNDLMNQIKTGVLFLSVANREGCQLLIRVSPDLIQRGIHANALIKEIVSDIEGSGGGKKESAQAGGKNSDGIKAAFEKIKTILQEA